MKPLVASHNECFKKARYSTHERAEKYRKKAQTERGVILRSYYCKICMGFHLTSKPLIERPLPVIS